VNPDVTVTGLIGRLSAELQQWENKRKTAETAFKEATARVEELRQTLETIRRYAPGIDVLNTSLIDQEIPTGEFSQMSTREAVRIVLQRADKPLTTAEITDVLVAGGAKSGSANFRSNVSATLSVMQSKYQEVIRTASRGWILSQPNLLHADHNEAAA